MRDEDVIGVIKTRQNCDFSETPVQKEICVYAPNVSSGIMMYD